MEAQHPENLALLGVHAQAPEPGRIVFHETQGYAWTERAVTILKRSAGGRNRGDVAAVLRELLAEPSGLIEQLLRRMDTAPQEVLTRLDETAHVPEPAAESGHRADRILRAQEAFVPAPVAEVWALLTDPGRLPEWEPVVASVDAADASAPRVGAVWTGAARTEGPDGNSWKVKPEHRRLRIELREYDEPALITWRLGYPDAQQASSRSIRIELTPATGGTQLRVAYSWQRGTANPPQKLALLAVLARPVYRYLLWMQTNQIVSGISCVFRGGA